MSSLRSIGQVWCSWWRHIPFNKGNLDQDFSLSLRARKVQTYSKWFFVIKSSENTAGNTSMNSKYNIRMYQTRRIFGRLLWTLNKLFLENSLYIFVALIFTLLLVSFECKLVNFFPCHHSLKTFKKSIFYITFEANRTQKTNFHESSMTQCSCVYQTISTQKILKEAFLNGPQIF